MKPDEKKINGTSVVATNEEKVIPGIKLKITAANADKSLFWVTIFVEKKIKIVDM